MINTTPLIIAVRGENIEISKILLARSEIQVNTFEVLILEILMKFYFLI